MPEPSDISHIRSEVMCHRSVFGSVAFGVIVSIGRSLWARSPEHPPHRVFQTGPVASVTSVAVSPDGTLLAAGSAEGEIRLYDARTGALVRVTGSEPCRGVHAVAFAPDGVTIASGGLEMDKTLKTWNVRTGALIQTLLGHGTVGQLYAEINSVAFSPGGKLIASAGRDGQVIVWNLEGGTLLHRLGGHRGAAVGLAFAPGGQMLASGGEDRLIRIWDIASGRLIRTLDGHRDAVCALAFSPSGDILASADTDWAHHRGRDASRFPGPDTGRRGEWRLWDASTGAIQRTKAEPDRVSSLAFSPDGQSLACGVGREVRLYQVRSESSGRTVISHDGPVTSLAFAPDGKALYSGSHDRTARRVNFPSGMEVWRAHGYWEQVNSVAISSDGRLIAAGSSDGRCARRGIEAGARGLGPGAVRLWDADTGRLLRRLGEPAEQIMAVAISPDGQKVASAGASTSDSGTVHLWEAATGEPIWSANDHTAVALGLAFARDGSVLATASADGTIKIRDARTGSIVRSLVGHAGGVTSVAFSGDGALLCGGGADEGAYLWDARTGKALRTIRAAKTLGERVLGSHVLPHTSVALSIDGSTLVACSGSISSEFGDRKIRVWDTRDGALRREFSRPQSAGMFVALAPDGATVATSGLGKSIALWEVKTGRLIRELQGHIHPAPSAVFSADGRILVSGGDSRMIKVWEVATGRLLATMATFNAGRPGPAADEWLAYTADGFYSGSPGMDGILAWRVGNELQGTDSLGARFNRPDRVAADLAPRPSEPESR
jgi:WD40 repeat protein